MKPNVLKDFFNMSHWQSLLVVIFLFASFILMWFVIKKFKLKFQYRILLGLGIGVIFGLAISGGAGFPNSSTFKSSKDWGDYQWGYEASEWFKLFSSLFISGLMIMILPIIFLSIARIVSKQSQSNLAGITWKGIVVLLVNVAVAFTITFWLGYIMKVGDSFKLSTSENKREPMKSLTSLLSGYMPNNFFKVMGTMVIIPVLVMGAIIGYAVKKSSKKYPQKMEVARENLDRYWKIAISVLMLIIKFMPYAVLTMIGRAIFSRPIGEFASIGELIGLGYLGLFLAYGWHVLTIWLFGISPTKFVKRGYKPVLSGFLTQSSVATLPLSMDTLKQDMELGEKASSPDVIMPLSTTLGLTGCAGVQSGVILTLLNNSIGSPINMNIGILFLLGIIITLFASLGIAGVPGTATIVTIGVVSTLGFPAYVNPTIQVISPLNGIFDMGRTAVNVSGGLQASLISSQIEGELPKSMETKGPFTPLIKKYQIWSKKKRASKSED